MKLKNIVSVLLAAAVLGIAAIGFAADRPSPLTLTRAAIAAAKSEIPASCDFQGYKTQDENSLITFQDPATLEYYFVTVATATSKVEEVKVEGAVFVLGSTVINKNQEDIEAAVLAAYPDARDIAVSLVKDGNNSYYQAFFAGDRFKGELKFNPATGVIIERELEYY